ncbi:aromatic ring-hydroxylating oxygenase subunit alpha [Litorimonas sp. RW-G-Af-16]|uniref:aromatic ring-hydroxylating oxygenase subunit alpha n=1 Tax=Litorimonas sp. RW-G-Af-16 TaxID=3241168 RepID=UPI00390C7D83
MSLGDVLKPIEAAHGLPNAHYISEEMYKREREIIFYQGWAAAAFEADVKNPGDAFPVDFLGMPLLLVRSKTEGVKVYQNTCRHRGMILIDQPTRLKGPIRCPYHSWCYSHEGALVRTPYIGGVGQDTHDAIDPDRLGLFEVRSHIWHGTVFVNVSGDAKPFEVVYKDLIERWAEFDKPFYVPGPSSQFDMTLNTNWKLAIENFCESYHLPWVHPELNEISKIDDHYNIDEHETYAGQGSLVYRQLKGEAGKVFPDFEGVGERWNTSSEYASFFPNVMMGVHRDHAYSVILMPQGPERITERVAMFYAEDLDERYEPMLAENARIWRDVFSEDVTVVEGMQKGRHGPMFDGGKFSPVMDGPTHVFHKWIARHMQSAE